MAFSLVSALLGIGGTLLRGVGARKGGVAAIAANAVADVLDAKPSTAQVQGAIDGLPPEQRAEVLSMLNEAERIKADLEKTKILSASNDFQQEQETHRAALASTDNYTRRTRPHIARMSFYAATVYVGAGIIIPLVKPGMQLDMDTSLYLALIAPALTYMGVRTFDKVGDLLKRK
jgi:hypothetical protein